MALRAGLLAFIADFANWDLSASKDYLKASQALVQVAHECLGGSPGIRPIVVDPFAGGGAIPLEALRLGCDVTALDLNPVAYLILKCVLEYQMALIGVNWIDAMNVARSAFRSTVDAVCDRVFRFDSSNFEP